MFRCHAVSTHARFRSLPHREHAVDGGPCPGGDLWIDLHLRLQGLERAPDLRERDPLHVRTEIAGRTNSTSGTSAATLSLIEHSVSMTTRAGRPDFT